MESVLLLGNFFESLLGNENVPGNDDRSKWISIESVDATKVISSLQPSIALIYILRSLSPEISSLNEFLFKNLLTTQFTTNKSFKKIYTLANASFTYLYVCV